MIYLQGQHQILTMPRVLQGLANQANTRPAVAPEFFGRVQGHTTASPFSLRLTETTMDRMIVKYSEQAVFQPLLEIRHWFTYASGAYTEQGYPPLFYARTRTYRPSPNVSAVAAVGEGIAGFIAQRVFHCRKLARPNHDYPDIVMEIDGVTYLIEAKATMSQAPDSLIAEFLPRLAANTASAGQIDVRPVVGILVATRLASETEYETTFVEVRLI